MMGRLRRRKVHDELEHPLEVFFWNLRQTRRERRAPPGTRKTRVVITMVHDESVFFPIWLGYYSRFFAPDDIYVLDNDTTDGSTSKGGFVRIPVSHDSVDHTWMVQTIQSKQHELLERYDVVLVTDVDEIVTPNPQWGGFGEYLDGFDEEFVTCFGYEILHLKDREKPYEPGRPILDQRHYWFANDGYDKPALATVPMEWKPGFHDRQDEAINFDPDLRLIHLHRMDYEICLERHRLRQNRAWNQLDLDEGWAGHNRVTADREFERWFYKDSSFSRIPIVLERIPDAWAGLF